MDVGAPQFLYNVPYEQRQWYVVMTTTGRHFYFDEKEKRSYWQVADLPVDEEAFVDAIDFDEVALLAARASGLAIGTGEEELEKETHSTKPVDEPTSEREDLDVESLVEKVLEEKRLEEPASPQTEDSLKPEGLDLGYSSSEEDPQEEEIEVDVANIVNEVLEDGDGLDAEPDINAGLDLLLETEEDGQAGERFHVLLDSLKDQISLYDPWFIVEGELVAEFATHPDYHAVKEEHRERLFDQWVKAQTETKSTSGKYPTPTQKYLRFLQTNKEDMRKLYFGEFAMKHSTDLQPFVAELSQKQTETLYSQYKLTVEQFSKHERQQKKNGPVKGNLKKQRLDTFLHKKLAKQPATIPEHGTHFERWVALCDTLDLPQGVVEDPVNFLVGDEKRFESYQEYFS